MKESMFEHGCLLFYSSLKDQSFAITAVLILNMYGMPIYRESETQGLIKNLF